MNKFSHIQNLMFFKHIEKQNIQMDDNQNVYKNRTLPHNLQQPAQETTPIYNKQPRKPGYGESDLLSPDGHLQRPSRRVNSKFWSNRQPVPRAHTVTESVLHSCP